ncbi:hypothetical protein PC110_g20575 [Phytophthora cactorum]|uniref:Uncharacterized protein n=1 Tax=Phytophthora cactorum TaxID=29920 RepID=A0A329RFY2_9STRA|nr:hypothetical protein PC110_g20575 [Phytophthora cactorum]
MAEILYGDVNPSGKLPITYPKDPTNIAIPYNDRVTTRCTWDNCWMQWDFGDDLSYAQPFRKISVPEMKMLKKFKKIELQEGESMDVSFSLSAED